MSDRKFFAVLPIAAVIVLAGCVSNPGPAPVVTVTLPATTEIVTPPVVTETVNPPKSTPSTGESSEEAHRTVDCVSQGMNTDNWNTSTDVPSEDELRLKSEERGRHFQPSVDAPLVEVAAWPGMCFDTVMFTIDTTMNDPEHTDLPWFNVEYVDRVETSGQGAHVPLNGNGDLSVTFFAKGSSYVHWSGYVPPGMVDVMSYRRDTSRNFGTILEIVGAGDFENVVSFGVGVDEKRPFAVHFVEHDDMTAVVVRVAHR